MLNKIITSITLLSITLLAQDITVKPLDNISKKVVDIKKSIVQNGAMYEDNSVKKQIQKEKYFASAFIKQYKLDDSTNKALSLAINETLTKLYTNKLKEKYTPDSKVIKSFYLENKKDFAADTIVSISTIVLKTLHKADEVYHKIISDKKSFDSLAKENSLDQNIEFVDVSLSISSTPLRKWLRDAKVGDISEPIKIGNSYYIERLNKKEEKSPTYENLKPMIKDMLVNIYVNKLMANDYLENSK